MKRFIFIVMVLFSIITNAQSLGANGQGAMQNNDTREWQLIADLPGQYIVRFPGGADTKFMLTDTDGEVHGWDFGLEQINEHFMIHGTDENDVDDGLDKYQRKYQEQESGEPDYFEELIAIQPLVPNMGVIFCFNDLYSPARSMDMLNHLITSGVNVVGVVFGNETYNETQYNFNFEEYRNGFEPWAILIRDTWPELPMALCLAPNPERSIHDQFDQAVFAYIGDHRDIIDNVDVHVYLNQTRIPETWSKDPGVDWLIQPGDNIPELDTLFTTLFNESTTVGHDHWDWVLDYISQHDPFVGVWMTEWNTNPVAKFSNTISHGAFVFSTMNKFRPRVKNLLVHNGIASSDIGGIVSMTTDLDDVETMTTTRVGYYALKLAMMLEPGTPDVRSIQVKGPGTVRSWFAGVHMDTVLDIPVPPGLKVESWTTWSVSGLFPYSSAGKTSFMGRNTPKSMEIRAVDERSGVGSVIVPSNGFGILDVKFAPDTVPGCRDSVIVATTVIDRPGCSGCNDPFFLFRWIYRWTHRDVCRDCQNNGSTITIVTRDTITICDTIPDTGGDVFQDQNADTLFFHSEVEFRDHLRHWGVADWVVNDPVPDEDCHDGWRDIKRSYYQDTGVDPAQHFLFDSLFIGHKFTSIKDHSTTGKMIDLMIPKYESDSADLCDVWEQYTNPFTGQVVRFYDIYNWRDRNGFNIYNANLKLWLLWQFAPGVVSFPIVATHSATGWDYTFKQWFPEHLTMELNFQMMGDHYGWMLISND